MMKNEKLRLNLKKIQNLDYNLYYHFTFKSAQNRLFNIKIFYLIFFKLNMLQNN